LWSGGGVVFNNTVSNDYTSFIWIFESGGYDPKFAPYFFIWDNTLGPDVNFKYGTSGVEGVNYFLYPLEGYTLYPYPHPLTLT